MKIVRVDYGCYLLQGFSLSFVAVLGVEVARMMVRKAMHDQLDGKGNIHTKKINVIKFPMRHNPALKDCTGSKAYARATLRWKFQRSSELTGFYYLVMSEIVENEHDDNSKKSEKQKQVQDPQVHEVEIGIGGKVKEDKVGMTTKDIIMRGVGEGVGEGTEVPADSLQNDIEYVVDVTLGTPGVKLQLDFDTGSSDLWVFSPKLPSNQTANHTIYDPEKSSTAKRLEGASWNISYGDGSSASGDVWNDNVKLGSISIQQQAVELATKLSSQFASGGNDGLLGLAWPNINTIQPTRQPTPIENMIAQKSISQSLFTVKLDRGDDNSFYTFGEIDDSVPLKGDIQYADIDNSRGFWQFDSTSAVVNGKTVQRKGNTAIADTGTTLVLVDDATVRAIYRAIPGSRFDYFQGGYVYPTTTTPPPVSFAVGSTQISIPPSNFGYGPPTKNGFQFGGVQSRGNSQFDILGDVFLKGVYVVFDVGGKRLGVGQRSDV